MNRLLGAAAAVAILAIACKGETGPTGPAGPTGPSGPTGPTGQPGTSTGSIAGKVKDAGGAAIAGASIQTDPQSVPATSAADGSFTLSSIAIGSYAVTATKAGYAPFTLAAVGVISNGTTSVNLVMQVATDAPGAIAGTVTDSMATPTPLGGAVVTVEGTSVTATTAADGTFTLSGVPPGPVFLSATAPSAAYLPGETRSAVFVPAGGSVSGVSIVLSARPSDAAQYVGMEPVSGIGCAACHSGVAATLRASAHNRSLTRIQRSSPGGPAIAGAFSRALNATLKTPRTVMVPLAGTIAIGAASAAVVGTGTSFTTQVVVGDKIGYTPVGLGFYVIGTVLSIADDTHLTLAANAVFAPAVPSVSGVAYGTVAASVAASRIFTKMLPEDSNDIVAPAWPGVKATNPNYDANDPCIYGAPASGTCAAGGTAKYPDGQVNVYWCNLKNSTVQGVSYLNDEYVQKFGGSPWTCADGTFWDGVTTPAVPMVHIEVIYGGQGDKAADGTPRPNMGVFKQRFQGRLADVKAADPWTYTAGKELDSLTLPIQVLESGDRVNGGYKMNGYHPTEQKFPGESWSQRTRTFSHACAGCHNIGLTIDWDMETVTLPFGRDGQQNFSPMSFAAIKTYKFLDENLTCEHCHGPGKEHVMAGGGRGNKIINPKYLTAESERQLCGKCHAYDDATNAKPLQDYGFEYPWNSDFASLVGGGDYVPGVHQIKDFFDNWDERVKDDEAFWDPAANGGRLYGQAHRQQYVMEEQSKHANNPYLKVTCASCHDPHSQYLFSPTVTSGADQYAFADAGHRNNVACLVCHAAIPGTPFAAVTKDDVANVHVGAGGTATKDGVAVAPTADEVLASQLAVGNAVGQHMFDKANMMAPYNPTNDAMPVGRCTSCHMPKVAKSGGYVTGVDANGAQTLIEGDQASHVFDIIWPWQANAISRGGPSYQSGYYGQFVSAGNVKYDAFGYMPSSCSKCHVGSRRASIVCPDATPGAPIAGATDRAVWPLYWPLSEHRSDPFWSSCYTTASAP